MKNLTPGEALVICEQIYRELKSFNPQQMTRFEIKLLNKLSEEKVSLPSGHKYGEIYFLNDE